ncbi:MAG: PilZ domain-containing protein [Proteobacteria bacterium]|nr:PilZ domain-containing protein [Pseudomonadota bacterium]MBU1710275.1 PilZ domain-containing protein [Pseudomonadota bacterium]
MEEHRKEKRVLPLELEPVEVQIMGDGFLDILNARDIGRNGIGIFVPPSFASAGIEKEVTLIISLPGFKSFDAAGVIMHKKLQDNDSGNICFGINFTKIRSYDQEILRTYVENRIRDNRLHVRVHPSPEEPLDARAIKDDKTENVDIQDISLGGLKAGGAKIITQIPPDDAIDFVVVLPGGDKLEITGHLKHIDQDNKTFGLCFSELGREQTSLLEKYISRRVKELQKQVDYQS